MTHPQFKDYFRQFCQDVLSCLQNEPPKNCESFELQYDAGLCTNFTNWCWNSIVADPPRVSNSIHYLFKEHGLEPAHPFDETFNLYLKNENKYSQNKESNMLRLAFIKEHANV